MNIIKTLIQIMQLALAGMILVYLFMQYRARHKGSELVMRLRKHIVWETTALLTAFITAAFVSADGFSGNPVKEVVALAVTLFLFVTFLSGTRMFFDIASGKYDDQLK